MSEPEFVDSNVLVYAHDSHPDVDLQHERAKQLLTRLWANGCGRLSTQVLQEFYVTVTRKLRRPLSGADALALVRDYAAWPVYAPDARDVLEAIALHQESHVSYWDALILVSAAHAHCLVLWSEDMNSGQVIGGVTVRTPFLPTG